MNTLSYKQVGDYLLPDLHLVKQDSSPLGKYGRMRKRYLQEHNLLMMNILLLSGKLDAHLREVDRSACQCLDRMISLLMQQTHVSEELKASNPMEWVRQMNAIKVSAEEAILTELVYS